MDDIIFKPEDVDWFSWPVRRTLTLDLTDKQKVDLFTTSRRRSHYYLKEFSFTPNNNAYIPKLIAPLKVSGRKKRGLPYHATLESYSPENDWEAERLSGGSVSLFRSSLGLMFYISQDRPGIQFSTKVLATYMSHPSVKALAAIKHLASYLDGASDVGILLRRCDAFDTTFDGWNEEEIVEPDYGQDRSAWTFLQG